MENEFTRNILESKILRRISYIYPKIAFTIVISLSFFVDIKILEKIDIYESAFLFYLALVSTVGLISRHWSHPNNQHRLPQMIRVVALFFLLMNIGPLMTVVFQTLFDTRIPSENLYSSISNIASLFILIGPAYLFIFANVIQKLHKTGLIFTISSIIFASSLLIPMPVYLVFSIRTAYYALLEFQEYRLRVES